MIAAQEAFLSTSSSQIWVMVEVNGPKKTLLSEV